MALRSPITTLDGLILALNECGNKSHHYNEVMRSLSLGEQAVSRFVRFESHHYTISRVFHCPDFELLLCCWEPGQKTQIHNHNGQEGWIFILEGELLEERFINATLKGNVLPAGEGILRKGRITYIHDQLGFHRVGNPGPERAISLHLYVQPFVDCFLYDEVEGVIHPAPYTWYHPDQLLDSTSLL